MVALNNDNNKLGKMSESLSLQAIRTANAVRESDEQRTETRKKNLLILVLHYLNEEGYIESAQTLERETSLKLSRFEVCDNVNLETVLMEYEAYYHVKFHKYPKITKKLVQNDGTQNKPNRSSRAIQNQPRISSTPSLPRLPSSQKPPNPVSNGRSSSASRKTSSTGQKNGTSNVNATVTNGSQEKSDNLALQGFLINSSTNGATNGTTNSSTQKPLSKCGKQIIDIRAMLNDATRLNNIEDVSNGDKLLKPLGGFVGYNTEWRELAQVISHDIYLQNPNVRWDDIIGLDHAKSLVKESVVYPIKYARLFTGILSPWKGLLLYGPPGTGKTLLAKAVATECNTTFFNISASSIVSKWRGDSEKLVRVLFELARFHAPSTIFLDELDSLMSQRGGGAGGDHEGSRRMKTELLMQMEGLCNSKDLVFLLAASNLPWELDHAMLRRLEKRILVGLPTHEARSAMFQHYLPAVVCSRDSNGLELLADLDYNVLAEKTEGYSGSDIHIVCKEAAMRPMRKIFAFLEDHAEGEGLELQLDTITTDDVEAALAKTKPSARAMAKRYLDWQHEYESV